MATKEHKRQAAGVIGALEYRVHSGPPIAQDELRAAADFLRNHDFSPASDYFQRLSNIQNRVQSRPLSPTPSQAKRNYGGEAGGYRMQVQSVYDHVILSTCYEGDFRSRHGRVKISHRFNAAGRVDFVELKFLRALHPVLNGSLRKLLVIRDYASLKPAWHHAEAFVLQTLPQELLFLYHDIFRSPKDELFAWLMNIGHGIAADLLEDLRLARNGAATGNGATRNGNGYGEQVRWVAASPAQGNGVAVLEIDTPQNLANGAGNGQLPIQELRSDQPAMDILRQASVLTSAVELLDPRAAVVRYVSR